MKLFLSYILMVGLTSLWWTKQSDAQWSPIKWVGVNVWHSRIKVSFKKSWGTQEKRNLISTKFHREIKCILKLTSPNQIQQKGSNYSTYFIVSLFSKSCMTTVKLFEMLVSKPRILLWVKKNKCKFSQRDWKPECSP